MVKALTFHHKKYGGTPPYLRILLKSFKLTTRCSLQRIYNKFSRTIMIFYSLFLCFNHLLTQFNQHPIRSLGMEEADQFIVGTLFGHGVQQLEA